MDEHWAISRVFTGIINFAAMNILVHVSGAYVSFPCLITDGWAPWHACLQFAFR